MKSFQLVLVALVLASCNKSGSKSPVAAITDIAIPVAYAADLPECSPAKGQSVLFVKDTAKFMFCGDDSQWVEVSVQASSVDAKDVTIGKPKLSLAGANTTAGYLTATNLQDALSIVAADLTTVLPGSTWSVVNKTRGSFNFMGNTGKVRFNQDGSVEVLEGRVAALGMTNNNCGGDLPEEAYSYELIAGGMFLLDADVKYPSGQQALIQSVIKVTAQDNDHLVVLGYGACGPATEQLSLFTRIAE